MKSKTFVALLRGINVGGKNKLPMADLVALFERAGCVDVRHYIQSGNVVFGAPAERGAEKARAVAEAIEEEYGIRSPVVVRTAEEMSSVIRTNPYLEGADADADLKTLHVMFLAETPAAERSSKLDPGRSRPDSFVLRGREVFLRLPNGVAGTKLTNAYFDGTLKTTSTMRNWATVLKLGEMANPPK